MNSINIGILAHVDAGKTSLTERLLFDSGVIKTLGSVDKGNTQTDSMALERQRGITIKSAVVSFSIGDLKINLIDTPGHPDFIAEVERALRVLDAVVLVISAVEGVQPQTRVLMKALKRLSIPTVIFINKVDRLGARGEELIVDIQAKLFPRIVAMNSIVQMGSSKAETMAINDTPLDHKELVVQISRMQCIPIVFGSALTGVGISDLVKILETHFAPASVNADTSLSAVVFKVERGVHDEKIAYVRVYTGEMQARSHVEIHRVDENGADMKLDAKITSMRLFKDGSIVDAQVVHAGDIAKVVGLQDIHVNDWIGQPAKEAVAYFPRPNLEVVVAPQNLTDKGKLYAALQKMSEQDPLLQVRQSEGGILSIRLYGEVQREIIEATLRDEYDLGVKFEEIQVVYIEKPIGIGKSFADKTDKDNFFEATLGFTVEPGVPNGGITFIPGPGRGGLPNAFIQAVEDTVYKTLQQGLYGWEVTDCMVEVTEAGYWDATSTGGDFRGLTPLLLMEALKKAGTEVYEPLNKFEFDVPESLLGQMLPILSKAEARITETPTSENGVSHIKGLIPVRTTFNLERGIPNLTQGEGVFTTEFGGYQKVHGTIPTRPRTDNNPLNKEEYLRRTFKRGSRD